MIDCKAAFCAAILALTFMYCQGQTQSASEQCVKVGPCSCAYSNSYIDLSPVAANPGPKFKDILDKFGFNKFSYNPCTAFTEGSCTNMAVCQQNLQSQFFPCGTQESANFKLASGTNALTLEYSVHDGAVTRTSLVELVCSTNDGDILEASGESPQTFYNFKLTSKACCPQTGSLNVSSPLSAGSIVVIIFFVFLAVYLLVGVLFQKFARKANGKEIFPNYSFWSGFPGLVKDGACFVVRRGKSSNYSSI